MLLVFNLMIIQPLYFVRMFRDACCTAAPLARRGPRMSRREEVWERKRQAFLARRDVHRDAVLSAVSNGCSQDLACRFLTILGMMMLHNESSG